MARYRLGMGGYSKYQHFLWSDYVARDAMTKAFDERHSNGSKQLKIRGAWQQPVNRRKRKRKRLPVNKNVKKVVPREQPPSVIAKYEYDSEEGDWNKCEDANASASP